MPKITSLPWSADDDEILTHHMNTTLTPNAGWTDRSSLIPGKSGKACQTRWGTVLMKRDPTAEETKIFATIYKGSADPLWATLQSWDRTCGDAPWAGLGDDKYELTADGQRHWYKWSGSKLWQTIATEMKIPLGVVETMFFGLTEREREVGARGGVQGGDSCLGGATTADGIDAAAGTGRVEGGNGDVDTGHPGCFMPTGDYDNMLEHEQAEGGRVHVNTTYPGISMPTDDSGDMFYYVD